MILGLSSPDQPTRLPIRWNADDAKELSALGIPASHVVEPPPAPRHALLDDGLGANDDDHDARGGTWLVGDSSDDDLRAAGDDDDAKAFTTNDIDNDEGADLSRDALRRRDRFERELCRVRARRQRRERILQRRRTLGRRRGRSPEGPGSLDAQRLGSRDKSPRVPPSQHVLREPDRDRQRANLPADDHRDRPHDVLVATHGAAVKRFVSGPLHGTALALYFLLLPFVIVDKWRSATLETHATLIRGLLVALAAFWIVFAVQVGRQVVRVRRGESAGPGGSAWLAGVVVAVAAVLVAPGLSSAAQRPPSAHSAPAPTSARHHLARHARSIPAPGALALAVAARRRRDLLRAAENDPDDDHVENSLALLRHANPRLLASFNSLVAERREGIVRVRADFAYADLDGDDSPTLTTALCLFVLADDDEGTVVSFAREGGHLRVPESTSTDALMTGCVCAHDHGSLRVATTEAQLLRELAIRSLGSTLVLYDGPPVEVALAARCVLVTRTRSTRVRETIGASVQSRVSLRQVRAEFLRAEPRVVGLAEPFLATLQRRCVEMTAYLALHRHDPVTGDRLRTRVLAHADVDASARTLANVASTIRRSLGADERGPRLHPVSSAALYNTHGLDSDVEEFHRRVSAARESGDVGLLRGALELVQGEPLASVLGGFEWFLAEGHWARLLREGEWAALALSRWAVESGDVELAFWAIERGRLLDPYSDVLASALAAVPRLREFGGDGTGAAQHEAVGAGGAVVTRGPGGGFGEQVL